MLQIIKENFNLEQICQSGQCFRMNKECDGKYSVIADGRYLKMEQQGDEIIFHCDEMEFEEFWKGYFDLDCDYNLYLRQVDAEDSYLVNAVSHGSGIRILRQDLWEMTASFLISQQNHIARIRRCISNLCEQYGEKKTDASGRIYHTFPGPENLAGLPEDALFACNLGYRSKYVVRSAGSIVSGEVDLDAVRRMPYREAREELLKLYGVGEKVADCICLFSLHHLQAFPVDTHIRQALESHYRAGFPMKRYEGYQGVIQQYIFYYELFAKEREKEK